MLRPQEREQKWENLLRGLLHCFLPAYLPTTTLEQKGRVELKSTFKPLADVLAPVLEGKGRKFLCKDPTALAAYKTEKVS